MIEDAELLRRYAGESSQEAFAELVRRRVDFVYTVALRQVGGDAHLAQDVTQKVFVDLARKASELSHRAVLSGWLCRSTQFAASDVVRAERRRRAREQESHAMHETSISPASAADWEKLRPLLDEAMNELADDDRDAVALRYFDERPFAEIGRALRLTEEAARKRVERALDRLAAVLSRRGVTSTSAALGLALANQALVAAPAGLVTTITGAALAGTAATAGTGAIAGGLFLGFMGATKTTVGIAAAVAALATGGAMYGYRSANESRAVLAAAEAAQTEAQARLRDLDSRVAEANRHAQSAENDNATLRKTIEETKRLAASVRPPEPPSGPVTQEMVQSRYRRAQELARGGNWEQALPELLWCYDDGMQLVPSYSGVRNSFLTGELGRLAKNYPPALEALRTRRDQAEKRMMASVTDREAARDFSALNDALGETQRTLQSYEQLPPGDPRRDSLASLSVFALLLESKRYAAAVEAQPYDQMLSLFERTSEPPAFAGLSDPEGARQSHRTHVVERAARNIEALAGAGELANARAFIERVLRFDNSPEARAVLREHLTRVGHVDLLPPSPKP